MLSVAGLAVAGVAAGPAVATEGGDNGDVKIHRATTPDDDPRNQPKVCEFYLVGFDFDGAQDITWWIQEGPKFGQPEPPGVLDGTLSTDESGFGRTDVLSLPDGHYKLWWTFEGEQGSAKHKVFKVDCGEPDLEPIPGATVAEVCPTEEGGESGVEVTLMNTGDADAKFIVDGNSVTVAPGETKTVFVPVGEDEDYDIIVSEETIGTSWEFKGTLNCEEPEPEPAPGPGAGFTESCEDGGVIVFLDNIGDADANFTVETTINGEEGEPIEETIAPGEDTSFLVELEHGDDYLIVVTDDTTFLAFVQGTFVCPEEEPEPPTETPTPTVPSGELPKTGSGFPTATAAWLAVFLLATGGFLLTWRRGMLPIPYHRKH